MKTIYTAAKSAALIAILSSSISPVAAQSYHPSRDYGANELRAGASIVIPFGGDKKKANAKPRVEFSFQQSRVQQEQLKLDFNRYSLQQAPIVNRNTGRVGFTLDQNPQMLVNGRAYRIDEQKNISVLGIAGIALAIPVVIVATGLIIIASDSDSGDDE